MGKCILAGHPPAGGQIGYGTYIGNGAASRTISLGVTPKWVLVMDENGVAGNLYNSVNIHGGLAIQGSPIPKTGTSAVGIVSGGFNVGYVYVQSTGAVPIATNSQSQVYNYIYGT